jgi:hypothetical protein
MPCRPCSFVSNVLTLFTNEHIAKKAVLFGLQRKNVFARPLFPKDINGFGAGNVFVSKVMLSGDVCIYDYEKFASELKPNQPN